MASGGTVAEGVPMLLTLHERERLMIYTAAKPAA
jgi:hypothetical protein